MRFALLWFEQVTEPTRISLAETFHHFARLVARIIIHHQHFPFVRDGKP